MNYRSLLLKYIRLVDHEEGVTYVDRASDSFTDEEKRELIALEAECRAEQAKPSTDQ